MLNLLAVVWPAASGATLELAGTGSSVLFSESGASITASCQSATTPAWVHASPAVMDAQEVAVGGSIKVHLTNVRNTCTGQPNLNVPCAAHDPDLPKLFHCAFEGAASTVTTGPVHANRTMDMVGEVTLGVSVSIACPLPSFEQVVTASGYTGAGGDTTLKLLISYLHPTGTTGAVPIAYDGVANSNIVIRDMLVPPVSPPTSPPGPPPPSPASPCGYTHSDDTCPLSSLGGWGVCAVFVDDAQAGLSPPKILSSNSDGLSYIKSVYTEAPDGGYKFVNDAGTDWIAVGNACPNIVWDNNWYVKAQARRTSDFGLAFESAEFAGSVFGGQNPFTVMGDNIYQTDDFGIYNRNSMATYATSANGQGGCARNNNNHLQGSTICFSSADGSQSLSISANVNNQINYGIYMCNVNSWCGGGANGYMMLMLVQYRG